MTRPHLEQHEPWLVEALDGRLAASDERRAVLADCEVCGRLLADMEALRDGLDDAGRLERDVLAEVAGARDGAQARPAAEQARTVIARLAAPRRAFALRRLVPLAAAAALLFGAYWLATHWRADEPAPAPSAPQPQLGMDGELRSLTVARAADGGLELAWEPVGDAYEYDVELLAEEPAAGAPLVVVRGLAEPRCAISGADAARLPARVVVRVQPGDIVGARMTPLCAAFVRP
jgi:hypothetical protein